MTARTKTKLKVSANPIQVEFPSDPYQVTQKLRAEGIKAAGRVNGQKDKLETLVKTLDVLRAHAIARYKKHEGMSVDVIRERAERTARENAQHDRNAVERVERLRAELEQAEAALPADKDAGQSGDV